MIINTETISPPVAKKIYQESIHHNDKRIDYYDWLKDKSNPEVIEYLEAENEYTKEIMKDTVKLQNKLYGEFLSRIKQNDDSAPYKHGDYFYYYKEEERKNHHIYFRKKDKPGAEEEMILDVNEIAKDLSYCDVVTIPAPDNSILSYLVDTKGDFAGTIYFKDLSSGLLLKDEIKNAGLLVWFNDNKTIYYIRCEKGNLWKQVYKHKLGTKQEEDILIYSASDERYFVEIGITNSKRYIYINSVAIKTNELRYINADDPEGELKLFQPHEEGMLYQVEHNDNKFYLRTNSNAFNYRIMVTDENSTGKDNWREFIPEKKDVKLEGFVMFKDYLAVIERDYGLNKLKIVNLNDNSFHYVKFPEPVYTIFLHDNWEFDTKYLRFRYTSMTTPWSVYDYDMENDENILIKQNTVLGAYNKDDYISERLFAAAEDGKLIPISLVYKKSISKNGKNPLYIHSYGSYGVSSEVWFSSLRLSLLDRGFIFAIAHIRGGGELGEMWYEEGKLLKKKNTFSDFITCVEFLIKEGYTYPGGIAAIGASAGGLLLGAVANMRPDLFNCLIELVPYVDVLNVLFDDDVENAKLHYDENGDPNIREYYNYIKSYSPYENIAEQRYPNILVTCGLHDANVKFWEPVKYIAKLREYKKDNSILILKTDFDSAHFGPSGRYNRYKEAAFEDAFILKCFGIVD